MSKRSCLTITKNITHLSKNSNRKKTTDDCYTPPLVYDAVRTWACNEYGIDPAHIVRPFYPGGDYEKYEYPDGCVVLDNPPFSILSKICEFYLDKNIQFFLFAPSLTAFCGRNVAMRMNHIICGADIVYENGAVVCTSFVTSFGGDIIAQTAPDLRKMIADAVDKIKEESRRVVPQYTYPDHVLTAAMLKRYSKYGVDFSVNRKNCMFISKLDAQKEIGKAIYGGGLLLSDKSAAERAAATVWELSSRELEMVATLK